MLNFRASKPRVKGGPAPGPPGSALANRFSMHTKIIIGVHMNFFSWTVKT